METAAFSCVLVGIQALSLSDVLTISSVFESEVQGNSRAPDVL